VADEGFALDFGALAQRKLEPTIRRFCRASMDLSPTGKFSGRTKSNAGQTETCSGFTTEHWAGIRTRKSSAAGGGLSVHLPTVLRDSQASSGIFCPSSKFRVDRHFGLSGLKVAVRTGIGDTPVFSGEMANRTRLFRP